MFKLNITSANSLSTNTRSASTKSLGFSRLSASGLIAAAILASASQPTLAARSENQQAALEAGTITTTAVAGAAAGGPAGFIIGGFIGMFLSHETRKGNEAEHNLAKAESSLETLTADLSKLETTVEQREMTIAEMEQKTIDRLALQVLFGTGEESLTEQDENRIQILAEYLKLNDELHINLSGHTDPRGDQNFNLELATKRAQNVADVLVSYGIPHDRIITTGHGANFSTAQTGEYDNYARERRVDIEIINVKKHQPVAVIESIRPTQE